MSGPKSYTLAYAVVNYKCSKSFLFYSAQQCGLYLRMPGDAPPQLDHSIRTNQKSSRAIPALRYFVSMTDSLTGSTLRNRSDSCAASKRL